MLFRSKHLVGKARIYSACSVRVEKSHVRKYHMSAITSKKLLQYRIDYCILYRTGTGNVQNKIGLSIVKNIISLLEVDFLIQRENDIFPVEVKSETNTTSKSITKPGINRDS